MRILVLIATFFAITNAALAQKEAFITTSDKTKLYVKTSGEGPVCIYVHGGPGAWSKSFEDMGGSRLEKKLAMVYYDQRGCGRSDSAATHDYSLERMADDIEDIRNALGAKKVYLLSHSFGGIIALAYAKRYPASLQGLILANSTLDIKNSVKHQLEYINSLTGSAFPVSNRDSLLSTFFKAMPFLAENGMDYKMLADDPSVVEKLNAIDNSVSRNREFAEKVWEYPAYFEDHTPATANVRVPVLVITGTKDHAIGIDHCKLFRFPNQIIRAVDAGHVAYYEKNKAFVEAVFDFVK